MGRGSESTLRIDEPLHFLFLIAYFITYFCCAYLMFICFKHCRRMWRRKPCRPSRIRNVAELVNNFHASGDILGGTMLVPSSGGGSTAIPRQVQVSIQPNGICSELLHGGLDLGQIHDTSSPSDDEETSTSRVSPFISPLPRFRVECVEQLPSYDSISEDSESPPPSYDSCVLHSLLPDNKESTNREGKHVLPA